MTNPAAVRMRRDFDKILTLIRTHAMLHQGNRESIDGNIVATLEDYAAVFESVSDLISEGIVARSTRRFVRLLRQSRNCKELAVPRSA